VPVARVGLLAGIGPEPIRGVLSHQLMHIVAAIGAAAQQRLVDQRSQQK